MAETMTGGNQGSAAPPDMRGQERQEGWSVPIDRIDAFTSGATMSVDPSQIEKELANLWRQAADRARKAGSQLAVTRACLWNLAVHVVGEEDFRTLKGVLDKMSEAVPTRLIVLLETRGTASEASTDSAPLKAYVEANFRQGADGRREIIAEEITLETPREEVRRLPALVRSLLLADLPTALYFYGGLPEQKRLDEILAEVDRVIIDTGKQQGAAALKKVGSALRRTVVPAEIADLGWLRVSSWRKIVASLFDPPEARAALDRLTDVQIRHVPQAESDAYLLTGWLAARLQWGPIQGSQDVEGARSLQILDKNGRNVNLLLGPAGAKEAPGGIHEVMLRTGDQVYRATATSGRSIELHSPLLPPQVQLFHQRSDAELLVTALGVGGRDPLMYEALCRSLGLCPAESSSK